MRPFVLVHYEWLIYQKMCTLFSDSTYIFSPCLSCTLYLYAMWMVLFFVLCTFYESMFEIIGILRWLVTNGVKIKTNAYCTPEIQLKQWTVQIVLIPVNRFQIGYNSSITESDLNFFLKLIFGFDGFQTKNWWRIPHLMVNLFICHDHLKVANSDDFLFFIIFLPIFRLLS